MSNCLIGREIARVRREKGLTQSDLGARAGVAQNTISTIESGKTKTGLRPEDAIKIATALQEPELLASYCRACPVRPIVSQDDPAAALEAAGLEMKAAAERVAGIMSKLTERGFSRSEGFLDGVAIVRSAVQGIEAAFQGIEVGA